MLAFAAKLHHADGPSSCDVQVVDARPPGRFEGKDPEPRPGLRMGSMKNSINVPFASVLNGDGTLKSEEELA